MRKGLYSGSFDPITNGHLNIIERSLNLFDKLYIVVANNRNKKYLFSLEERYYLVKEATKKYPNVEVRMSNELMVDFAKNNDIKFMVRGLRAVTDFEYELQMTDTNHILNKNIETIFIMAHKEYSYLSSSLIKEIASYNGDITNFVPLCVKNAIIQKYKGDENFIE